jgi:hypothetical protein
MGVQTDQAAVCCDTPGGEPGVFATTTVQGSVDLLHRPVLTYPRGVPWGAGSL